VEGLGGHVPEDGASQTEGEEAAEGGSGRDDQGGDQDREGACEEVTGEGGREGGREGGGRG